MRSNNPSAGGRFNVYLDSESVRDSFDSLEGVYVSTEEGAAGSSLAGGWRGWLLRAMEGAGRVLPGLVLAGLLGWAGAGAVEWVGHGILGLEHSPVSPILITVLLGLLMRNIIGLPKTFESGLTFCVKRLLRIGVALLGLRLSLGMAGEIGVHALPIVACTIVVAFLLVSWLGRWLGVSPRLTHLIGVGTAICGVSAIVATAPSIDAKKDEIGYAVGVITLFGLVALLAYPSMAHGIFAGDARLAGYFLGTSIHDTSQVAGAGLLYQTRYDSHETLAVATTVKLVRNLMMGLLIPIVAWLHHRRSTSGRGAVRRPLSQWIPLFIVGFVCMALVRSVGDMGNRPFGLLEPDTWKMVLTQTGTLSTACLTLAMAAVGLGTDFREFRRLGWRPLFVGMCAALSVGVTSYFLIQYFIAAS